MGFIIDFFKKKKDEIGNMFSGGGQQNNQPARQNNTPQINLNQNNQQSSLAPQPAMPDFAADAERRRKEEEERKRREEEERQKRESDEQAKQQQAAQAKERMAQVQNRMRQIVKNPQAALDVSKFQPQKNVFGKSQEEVAAGRQQVAENRQQEQAFNQVLAQKQAEQKAVLDRQDESKNLFDKAISHGTLWGQIQRHSNRKAADEQARMAAEREMAKRKLEATDWQDEGAKQQIENVTQQATQAAEAGRRKTENYETVRRGMQHAYNIGQLVPGVSLGADTMAGTAANLLGDDEMRRRLYQIQNDGQDDWGNLNDEERQKARAMMGVNSALGTLDVLPGVGSGGRIANMGIREFAKGGAKSVARQMATNSVAGAALGGALGSGLQAAFGADGEQIVRSLPNNLAMGATAGILGTPFNGVAGAARTSARNAARNVDNVIADQARVAEQAAQAPLAPQRIGEPITPPQPTAPQVGAPIRDVVEPSANAPFAPQRVEAPQATARTTEAIDNELSVLKQDQELAQAELQAIYRDPNKTTPDGELNANGVIEEQNLQRQIADKIQRQQDLATEKNMVANQQEILEPTPIEVESMDSVAQTIDPIIEPRSNPPVTPEETMPDVYNLQRAGSMGDDVETATRPQDLELPETPTRTPSDNAVNTRQADAINEQIAAERQAVAEQQAVAGQGDNADVTPQSADTPAARQAETQPTQPPAEQQATAQTRQSEQTPTETPTEVPEQTPAQKAQATRQARENNPNNDKVISTGKARRSSKEAPTLAEGRTGETVKGRHGNYKAKSIGQSVKDVDDFVNDSTPREIRQFLKGVQRKEETANQAQIERFRELNSKLSKEDQWVSDTTMNKIKNEHLTTAAQDLALTVRRNRQKMVKGTMSKNEFTRNMESEIAKTGEAVSADARKQIDTLADRYDTATNKVQEATTKADKIVSSSNASKDDTRAAIKELEGAQKELRASISERAKVILKEIDKIENKSDRRHAVDAFIKREGIYFHDWVDSSLLSGIPGRVFDQINGWSAAAEAVSPLTRMIDRAVLKRTGHSVGAAGVKSLGVGARHSVSATMADAATRQGMSGMGPLKTIRNATTTGVQFGDIPIESVARSQTINHYKVNNPNISSEKAELMALVDPDNIMDTYRNQAALEQGLGSKGYGASTAIRSWVKNILRDKPFAKDHPQLVDSTAKLADRSALGFWNVTKKVGGRSASRATFGIPKLAHTLATTPKGSLERAIGIRRALLDAKSGAEMSAVGFMAGAQGAITGAYPEDKSERARWEREGIQPNSIKIGNSYWEIPRLFGTFALPVMLGAQMGQNMENGEDLGHGFAETAVESFRGITNLEGVGNTFETLGSLFNGDFSSQAQQQIAGMLKMLTPLSSLHNMAANMIDDTKRETYSQNWAEGIANKLANSTFARFMLPPKTDWAGDPVNNTDRISRLFGANGTQQLKLTAVDKEIDRLAKDGIEITPNGNRGTIKLENGEDAKLTNAQQQALDDAVGKERYHQMDVLINSKYFEGKSNQEKADMLKKIYNSDDSYIKGKLAKDWGIEGAKQSTEKINSDLDTQDQAALLYHKSMDEESRKKWLDSNENAYDYYKANYYNKEKNDVLTENDKDLKYGGSDTPIYKYKEAEFNKEHNIDRDLSNKYAKIGVEEWRKLEKSDPDLYKQLWALDVARTEANVSRRGANHSEQKYTLKKGSSGGGRSGGSSGSGKSASVAGALKALKDAPTGTFKPFGGGEKAKYVAPQRRVAENNRYAPKRGGTNITAQTAFKDYGPRRIVG